jgi:murein DD-endopeptidase MepM/ murein hydrolase activator NlpD
MKKSNNKILTFLRRNAVYFILSFCILAIGLSVTLMLVNRDNKISDFSSSLDEDLDAGDNQTPDDGGDDKDQEGQTPDPEPVIKVISFIMPVENPTEIGDYSATMVFNQTLGRYQSHMAMDFYAEEGAPVLAVYEGTVESVTSTLLQGTTIVINHGDGLKSIYNSLADGESVTVGQEVNQGDVIGEVSATNRQEYKDGPHLHFSVEENGEVIDPVKYLVLNEK